MKQHQHAARFFLWLTIPFSVVLVIVTGTSSCTDKKSSGSSFHFSYDSLKTKFDNATCITLTKSQIEKEWTPAFTDPGNEEKDKIKVIKFFTDVSSSGQSFTVTAQAYNVDDYPLGKLITLGSGENCGKTLPPYLRGISNQYVFSELNITNTSDGELKDGFKQLILDPYTYLDGVNYFLAFKIYVDDGSIPRAMGNSLPCPPCINCKLCPKICDNKCDTTVSE